MPQTRRYPGETEEQFQARMLEFQAQANRDEAQRTQAPENIYDRAARQRREAIERGEVMSISEAARGLRNSIPEGVRNVATTIAKNPLGVFNLTSGPVAESFRNMPGNVTLRDVGRELYELGRGVVSEFGVATAPGPYVRNPRLPAKQVAGGTNVNRNQPFFTGPAEDLAGRNPYNPANDVRALRRSGISPDAPEVGFDRRNREGNGVAGNLAGLRRDIAASPEGAVNLGNRGVEGAPDIFASRGRSGEVAFTGIGRGVEQQPDATGAFVNNGIGTAEQRLRAQSGVSIADEVRANRLRGGASEGAGILRQINTARRNAQRAFEETRDRTGSSQAGLRAAEAEMLGIDDLVRQGSNIVGLRRNQIGAESNQVDRERIAADQDFRAARLNMDAQLARAEAAGDATEFFRNDYLPLLATVRNKDGEQEVDSQLLARIIDLTSGIRDTRIARDVASMERAIYDINNQLREEGIEINDITELFDIDADGGLSFDEGKWSDVTGNTAGFGLREFFADLLPGGATGDVLTGKKNGDTVRISAGNLQRMGLTPSVIRALFGEESRRNR